MAFVYVTGGISFLFLSVVAKAGVVLDVRGFRKYEVIHHPQLKNLESKQEPI